MVYVKPRLVFTILFILATILNIHSQPVTTNLTDQEFYSIEFDGVTLNSIISTDGEEADLKNLYGTNSVTLSG